MTVQVVETVSVQSLIILISTTVLQTVLATFLGLLTGTWPQCLTGTLRQIGAEVDTGLTPVLATATPPVNPAPASPVPTLRPPAPITPPAPPITPPAPPIRPPAP